jgi:predicted acetyltransferase
MLTDPRTVRMRVVDALWLRLVDVEAALSARTYAGDLDVVIEVTDDFCSWNAGRYRLDGGGCARASAPADLALDVSALAAAYLGATTLLTLAEAGRVRELTPGALARASPAFQGAVAPWCPETF